VPKFSPLWEGVFFSPWTAGALLALIAATYILARKNLVAANPMRLLVSVTGAFAVILLALYLVQSIDQWNLNHQRHADRLGLETREHDLSTKALALPGLMCLDFTGSDLIENSCERLVFSGPGEISAAVAYISARLSLFAEESIYAKHNAEAFKHSRAAVQRAAERDRFGLYSHVLRVEYGCRQVECDFFPMMQDPGRLKANLRERVFDALLNRYAVTWTDPHVPQTTGSPQAATQFPPRAATMRGLDLPSANGSIPPVSIMAPEPAVSSAATSTPEAGRQNNPVAPGQSRPRPTKPQSILPSTQ
jgi:hypothetical protein